MNSFTAVNNVGVANSHGKPTHETTEDGDWEIITVNVASAPAMAKLVLPGMKARRRGAIINLSSVAGHHPCPLVGLYSATKVCVEPLVKFIAIL